jgi:FkbM family methyltransferase
MMISLSELVREHGARPRGVVHVGAHEAQELEAYEEHSVGPVVWIEANPEVYRRLLARIEGRPGHRAFQFAAHERDGLDVDLNVMAYDMSSSILYPKRHLELYAWNVVTRKVKVPTRTLDAFFRSEGLRAEEYNFLNMDIQGAELLALRGAREHLRHFDYVYLEVNDDELFENCGRTADIDAFLAPHGFRRTVTRMRDDGWGDAFYARQAA